MTELAVDLPLQSGADGEPFLREESGLVDLDSYRDYLVDSPDSVPTRPTLRDTGCLSAYMLQHVYFTEPLYRQFHRPPHQRDPRLRALRESPYSRIAMRRFKEIQLHVEKENRVMPPPEDTYENLLLDYFDIDVVGASIVGIRQTRKPKPLSEWHQQFELLPELKALSERDRIKIFRAEHDRALEELSSPRVASHMLVASALKRVAIHLKDHELEKIANQRLADSHDYYPLGVPKTGHLRGVGRSILAAAVGFKPLAEARIDIQAL